MQVTLRAFVKDLKQVIAQEAGGKSLQLGKGQCANMEEYKRSVGWIAGLNAAAELADKMMRQIEEMDDDDTKLPSLREQT